MDSAHPCRSAHVVVALGLGVTLALSSTASAQVSPKISDGEDLATRNTIVDKVSDVRVERDPEQCYQLAGINEYPKGGVSNGGGYQLAGINEYPKGGVSNGGGYQLAVACFGRSSNSSL